MPSSPEQQITKTETLQTAATANGNGTVGTADGYNGSLMLFVSNGAGTATLTLQMSLDATFTTGQDTVVPGLIKLWDSGAGTNTARSVLSGVLSVAANTSYLYQIAGDILPSVRAVISAASSLGAGTSKTGLTVQLYKHAV